MFNLRPNFNVRISTRLEIFISSIIISIKLTNISEKSSSSRVINIKKRIMGRRISITLGTDINTIFWNVVIIIVINITINIIGTINVVNRLWRTNFNLLLRFSLMIYSERLLPFCTEGRSESWCGALAGEVEEPTKQSSVQVSESGIQ